ncbi:MAG TPA: pyridoxal phosphate-dependent aminotransferase [Methylomirabilota bacterium]|nr:pyridoxal phosphate-dependent aminotransferase [Methylomirabilota bacterium]
MGSPRSFVGTRAGGVPGSLIRHMYDLGQATPGAISLAVGEPDFPTPAHIVEAGRQALLDGFTRYSPNAGYLWLREAIAEKLRKDNGLDVDPASQVFVTVGAMEALMLTFLVALDPGDEVLITDPSYCNYEGQITLAGARPVFVPTDPDRDYLPPVEALEAAVTPRTRAILVNSPSNPTGAVYPRDLLHAIAEVAVRRDLLLVSDEAYGALVYGDVRHVSPGAFPGLAERTVSIFSFSKEYAMTGWRVGYLTGPASMLKVMATVQEEMASCVNAAAQRAALAAVTGPQACVETMRQAYERRRDLVVRRLNAIPGVRCPRPDGAFYVFPDVRAITSDTKSLAERLLFDHGVVVSPGEAFGPRSAGFLRLSYAASESALVEGLDRLTTGLSRAATERR